jgi:predicted transcriptional regulator
LTPDNLIAGNTNLAWKAAMQARMANNCLMMENDEAAQDNEAQRQYEITEKFSAD